MQSPKGRVLKKRERRKNLIFMKFAGARVIKWRTNCQNSFITPQRDQGCRNRVGTGGHNFTDFDRFRPILIDFGIQIGLIKFVLFSVFSVKQSALFWHCVSLVHRKMDLELFFLETT